MARTETLRGEWSRRDFLALSSAALGAVLVPRGVLRAAMPGLLGEESAATRFEELRAGVGAFHGKGGTIGWFVSKEATVVIDSQFPDTAKQCLDGIKSRSTRPIDALLNSHHHMDHTGGNGVFKGHVEKIIAHSKVPELQKIQARERGVEKDQTYADTTFAEEWTLDAGGETISARHFGAAHTGGDIVIHFLKANVVHMGDLVFNRLFPFIDRPGGGTVRGWIAVLEKVAAAHGKESTFIFGHGKGGAVIGERKDLDAQRSYLNALWEYVEKGVKAGKSKAEIAAVTTLAGFEEYQSLGPALSLKANIEVAYDETTARP